ncbi:MAG: hypothetical protein IPL84_12970 [Chitinophagaceae bacterium]|nr:hypothetical protein [Chitinophagaceae bacterium]
MPKYIVLVFMFAGQMAFVPSYGQSTRFDKFIKKGSIEWAAYASDTFNFSHTGLNLNLLNRLNNKEIKASLPIESRESAAASITYVSLESIDENFYGDNVDYVMDAAGNEITRKKPIPVKDSSNFNITEVTQILYVEKGKLRSYIPYVTTALPVYTSSGTYIGQRFYFSTGYNFKYQCKARNIKKLRLLGQTKKIIQLEPEQPDNKLKEMYGHGLLETLWPQLMKK